MQQNSIKALHRNRNPLKQIAGLVVSLAAPALMEILLPRSARRWRADALKTPKVSIYYYT